MKKLLFIAVLGVASLALAAQAAPTQGAPLPQSREAPQETTLSGVLAFVGEEPAIKTDSGTVLLEMSKFYFYAYTDGLKAGMAVKVTGFMMKPAGQKAGQQKFVVSEMTINGKTYKIARGPDDRGGPAGDGPGRGGAGAPPGAARDAQ